MEVWGKILPFALLVGLVLIGFTLMDTSETSAKYETHYKYCSTKIDGRCD